MFIVVVGHVALPETDTVKSLLEWKDLVLPMITFAVGIIVKGAKRETAVESLIPVVKEAQANLIIINASMKLIDLRIGNIETDLDKQCDQITELRSQADRAEGRESARYNNHQR